MLRPVRSLVSLALLAAALWGAFAIDLGDRSFAEHIDTISETPEANELIEGTRSTVNPALAEVRDRVLGEYVEAPTWIADEASVEPEGLPPLLPSEPEAQVPASSLPASTLEGGDFEPPLPGRVHRYDGGRERAPTFAMEPPLPGHR